MRSRRKKRIARRLNVRGVDAGVAAKGEQEGFVSEQVVQHAREEGAILDELRKRLGRKAAAGQKICQIAIVRGNEGDGPKRESFGSVEIDTMRVGSAFHDCSILGRMFVRAQSLFFTVGSYDLRGQRAGLEGRPEHPTIRKTAYAGI